MATQRLRVLQPGERTNPAGKPVRNRILLSMPDAEYRSIRPHLEFRRLPHHHSLHEPHGKSKFVYFPNEGLISLVVAMMDGKTVEAGIVGKEGMAGTPAAVGLSRSPLREVVQSSVAGILQRMQTIEYIRGVVKIANRKKLDKFACECYAIIRQYNGEL